MVNGSAEQREYNADKNDAPVVEEVEKQRCVSLPEGFTPFSLSGNHREAPYITYLAKRGVTRSSALIYRMGYADTGLLSGRVIVPSFDSFGMINFWSARTIWDGVRPTYRLPEATKNIISNEHMVDWNKPVFLVEGIFDEIAVGPQAISLYGKLMHSSLAKRLVEFRPPIVYVCLDTDARKEAVHLIEKLVGYDVKCSLVDLPSKDPGSMTSGQIEIAVMSSKIVTGSAGLIGARL